MKTIPQTGRPGRSGEGGYVLVAALVTLLLLTVLGIWASRTTNVEIVTARNERIHQETFYQADAGAHLAERLIYHNMLCEDFEDKTMAAADAVGLPASLVFTGGGDTEDPYRFWDSDEIRPLDDPKYDEKVDEPTDTHYTFQHYPDPKDRGRHTNVLVGSKTQFKSGQGLLQSSGYEGFGSGAANVGYYTRYLIRSQHMGRLDSEYKVEVAWRLSGLNVAQARTEDCHYKVGTKTDPAP